MNKSYILIIVGLVILSAVGLVIYSQSRSKESLPTINSLPTSPTLSIPVEQDINYRASFAIFTNGLKRNFTKAMYHNLSEDVYIQADNPNAVHVRKVGITWNDFFSTLPFKLTKECLTTGTKETFCTGASSSLKFYLNEAKADDLLEREIQDGDKALITFGNENQTQIQNQLNQLINPKSLN